MTDIYDRPAPIPHARKCVRCEIMFTGKSTDMLCAVCVQEVADHIAKSQDG